MARADDTLFPCGSSGSYTVNGSGELVGTSSCSGDVSLDSSVVSILANSIVNTRITSLFIPASVATIEDGAIYDNSNLTSINVDSANTLFVSHEGVLYFRDFHPTSGGMGAYTTYTLLSYPTAKPSASYSLLGETISIAPKAIYHNSALQVLNIFPYINNIANNALDLANLTTIRFLKESNDPAAPSYLTAFDLAHQNVPLLLNIYFCGTNSTISSLESGGTGSVHVTCPVELPTMSYPIRAQSIPVGVPMIDLSPTPGGGAISNFQISPDVKSFGLTFNESTGLFSGTPTGVFDQDFTITAWNEMGYSTSNIRLVGQTDVCYTTNLDGTITGGASCTGDLIIDPYAGIRAIADYAFYFHPATITSVTIPDSVTSIGQWAFNGLTTLRTVNLSTTYSGEFGGRFDSLSLEAINIPESNSLFKSIDGVVYSKSGEALIYYPEGRTASSYEIPDGVKFIQTGAFNSGMHLEHVLIPNSVISIGGGAFQQNHSLKTVTMGTGVADIPGGTFYNNFGAGLDNVELNSSLRTIGEAAFVGLKWTSVSIPEGVTSIGSRAFKNNLSLREIFLPSTLTSLDASAFNSDGRLCQIHNASTDTSVISVVAGITRHCPPGTPVISSFSAITPHSVRIDFTAPADIGTSAINYYTLISSGGISSDYSVSLGTSITFSGLASETNYTFQISATNSDGTSSLSSPSESIRTLAPPIASVPDAPIIGALHKISDSAYSIDFLAPSSDGGDAITSYLATSTPGGLTGTSSGSAGGTIVISGLSPSTSYKFSIVAINSIGNSSPSAFSASTTPTMSKPLVVAKLNIVSFIQGPSGNSGRLNWSGSNINSVIYKGNPCNYPLPFKYGADTNKWDGSLINLIPGASYEVEIFAKSVDGLGESKKISFIPKWLQSNLPRDIEIIGDSSCARTSSAESITVRASTKAILDALQYFTSDSHEIELIKYKLNQFFALPTRFYNRVGYLTLPHSIAVRTESSSKSETMCSIDGGKVKKLRAGECLIEFSVIDKANNKYVVTRNVASS